MTDTSATHPRMDEYLEIYKAYLTEKGRPFTDVHLKYLTNLLNMIKERDIELLKILRSYNKFSRKIFTLETGIKLKAKAGETTEILKEYIGLEKIHAHEEAITRKKQEQIAEKEAKKKTDFEKLNAEYYGFLSCRTPLQIGNIKKVLNTSYRFSGKYSGVYTVKNFIEMLVARKECYPQHVQEYKYSGVSRQQFNKMSAKFQMEYERMMKNAGMIDVYYINGYKLGKTAYNYAVFLTKKS